jgi:RNA polymerase sigma factor (sigma-70 family)
VVEYRAVQTFELQRVTGVGRPTAGETRPSPFDRLFADEYAKVASIARRVLGDPSAAEDVAQEVFLDLHRRFGDDPGANAPAWLRTAAAHTALNKIRTDRRRATREEQYARQPKAVEDPTTAVEAAETGQTIRDALARIPKRHATVLALRYSGLSYAEMSSALGIGVNAVGTRLRRAEARLRKEIEHASS